MFASPITPSGGDGPLEDAADRAFQFLLDGVAQFAAPERARTVALWVWSTLHGLVMLEADCMLVQDGKAEAAAAGVIRELVRALSA